MTAYNLTSRSTVTLLAAFSLIAALFAYSFRLVRVQGKSMEPNYHNGQWLLVRRLNWPRPPVAHDDVVVFRLGRDVLVKRVAALPGEVPPIDDLRLLWFLHPKADTLFAKAAHNFTSAFAPVPSASLYVLGDNPPQSDDSRDFGAVPVSTVIGRVVQWDPPDAPEREQIGYAPLHRRQPLPPARPGDRKVLASAQLLHP